MNDFVYDNSKAQTEYTYGEIETALKCCYTLALKCCDILSCKVDDAEWYSKGDN